MNSVAEEYTGPSANSNGLFKPCHQNHNLLQHADFLRCPGQWQEWLKDIQADLCGRTGTAHLWPLLVDLFWQSGFLVIMFGRKLLLAC